MRDFKGMKRQRSRNRNPGGGGGGNKPQQHNANRAFDSNGPEGVKVRGAAQSVYEKYQQLARDAQTAGDRVLAENYLQHAEHYFRLLRAMQPLRPLSEIIGRDQFVSGYDIDFEDESALEAAEAAEAQHQQEQPADSDNRQENRQPEYRQNDFRRDDRPREDRYQGDRSGYDRAPNQGERGQNDRYQGDRPQNDRNRNDRNQGDRYQGGQDQQADRPRNDRNRDDRGQRPYRDDRPRYDDNRPREDRQQPVEAVAEAPAQPTYPSTPAPETRNPEPTSVLRADDGEVSAAPAFLQARPTGEGGEEVRRPRRRRAPVSFEPVAGASETDGADI
jgi:hypothetical protein